MTGREELGQSKSLKKSGWLSIISPSFPEEFFLLEKSLFIFWLFFINV